MLKKRNYEICSPVCEKCFFSSHLDLQLKPSVFVAQNSPVVELVDHTNQSPGPGCVNSTQCYDGDLDPKGEAYDGCVSTTESGKTCQVEKFLKTPREWQMPSLLKRLVSDSSSVVNHFQCQF